MSLFETDAASPDPASSRQHEVPTPPTKPVPSEQDEVTAPVSLMEAEALTLREQVDQLRNELDEWHASSRAVHAHEDHVSAVHETAEQFQKDAVVVSRWDEMTSAVTTPQLVLVCVVCVSMIFCAGFVYGKGTSGPGVATLVRKRGLPRDLEAACNRVDLSEIQAGLPPTESGDLNFQIEIGGRSYCAKCTGTHAETLRFDSVLSVPLGRSDDICALRLLDAHSGQKVAQAMIPVREFHGLALKGGGRGRWRLSEYGTQQVWEDRAFVRMRVQESSWLNSMG